MGYNPPIFHLPVSSAIGTVIVLDLCCDLDHRFEGWFGSAAAFASQQERGLVECPVCASRSVRRLPSAPYVQTRPAGTTEPAPSRSAPPSLPAAAPAPVDPAALDMALAMLRKIARDAEDVGTRLPEEARRMHYGETETRNIRGSASAEEIGELLDEGIMLMPLPPAEEDLH